MKKLFFFLILLVVIACQSKTNEIIQKQQYNQSQLLFLELWEVFDKNYAFFELRDVDWKAEKQRGLETVRNIQSDSLLFDAFCDIIKQFDDAHINLESDTLNAYCNAATLPNFFKEFPTNEAFGKFLNARINP